MVYHNFAEFYEKVVIPIKKAQPDWIRLDGQTKGSTRHIEGRFKHHNKKWEVHADTQIKPLDCAYTSIKGGHDPLIQKLTQTGKRNCLVLVKSLWPTGFKYLYIYEAR